MNHENTETCCKQKVRLKKELEGERERRGSGGGRRGGGAWGGGGGGDVVVRGGWGRRGKRDMILTGW